jgi:hypothetical protein
MNWFIFTPAYRYNCAGIRVLHRLCHKLNELGEKAFISTPVAEGIWNTPFKEQPGPDDIVIYPEITHGNPLKVKHVVRYVLYYPGVNGGEKKYDNSEMVIYFDEKYRICPGAVIRISTFNEKGFYDSGKNKTLELVFVGKGNRHSAPWPMSAIEITSNWPRSRDETIDLLRQAKYVYSYDLNTSILIEAYLCKARIYIPVNGTWDLYQKIEHRGKDLYDDGNKLFPWEDLTETKRLIELTKAYFAP